MKKSVTWNYDRLEKALNDELINIDENYDYEIENIVFDNRKISGKSLFIAKKGEKNDGHNFIDNVLQNTQAYVLANIEHGEKYKNEPRVIIVKDTVQAMESMAKYARDTVKGVVFGITGSMGKTTTKELFYNCFSEIGKTYCNTLSFNNYIGVMTTLCNTPQDSDYVIIEMGMSKKGEMEKLSELVRPDVTVILNIFSAHLEYFKEEKDIALAKSEIFKYQKRDGFTILNKNCKYFDIIVKEAKKNGINEVYTFSENSDIAANLVLKRYYQDLNSNLYKADYNINDRLITFDFKSEDYNIAVNLMSLLCTCEPLEINPNKFKKIIENFGVPRGRNNVEKVEFDNKHITIVNGSYNAVNPMAFIRGLDLMKKLNEKNHYGRKIAIFGDIKEAGEKTDEFIMSLKKPILESNIDLLISIGARIEILHNSIKNNIESRYFAEYSEVIPLIKNILKDGDMVFIKSSKSIKTWKIVDELTGYPTEIFE